MPIKKKNLPTEAFARNINKIREPTGNIYKSIAIISKRAKEVAEEEREELHKKLEEFAPASDNLEEVFENKEQIEISTYYERLPKPTIVALEEFNNEDFSFVEQDKKSKKELAEEGLTSSNSSSGSDQSEGN